MKLFEKIAAIFKVSPENAKVITAAIRKADHSGDPSDVDEALEVANQILKGYGVEPLRGEFRGGYYGDTEALYINFGDTYDNTLLYDTRTEKWFVTTWGDFVEKHPSRFRENPPEDIRPYAVTETRFVGRKGMKIISPKDVLTFIRPHLEGADREYFLSIIVNTRHEVVGVDVVSKGILDASLVHPREIFKSAINKSASSIILFHNHPSGNPSPSGEDEKVYRRIKEAGTLIGIPVLDSVILGDGDRYYSFMESANV